MVTALTELFQQSRTADTPIMVERIVDDINDIVRQIRFPDWQSTEGGKREVRKDRAITPREPRWVNRLYNQNRGVL